MPLQTVSFASFTLLCPASAMRPTSLDDETKFHYQQPVYGGRATASRLGYGIATDNVLGKSVPSLLEDVWKAVPTPGSGYTLPNLETRKWTVGIAGLGTLC